MPDEGLVEAIELLEHSNPVKQSASALVNYLEFCPGLSEGKLFGLLQAIQCSPDLPYHLAAKAQVALLKMWARTFSVSKHHVFLRRVFLLVGLFLNRAFARWGLVVVEMVILFFSWGRRRRCDKRAPECPGGAPKVCPVSSVAISTELF